MSLSPRRRRYSALGLISLLALLLPSVAAADPPERVARLAHISGAVSFSPAGEDEWVLAAPNRPLTTGDRVWVDAGSRAELELGGTSVRLGSNTSLSLLNLDDRVAQFQLAQGTVNVRARRMGADELVELDTPQLAFILRRAGEFRLDVDPDGRSTAITVRNGEGEAWGEGASFIIGTGRWYRFADSSLRDYLVDAVPPQDDFDRWAFDRDRRDDAAVAARYVAPEVIGYSDLDEYGDWNNVQGYGNVWIPRSVPSGWAPYRYGHWAWIEPWGWTWVDDAAWGFAPFHYGRWAYARNRWCWVPGPIRAHPVYAPALVAFVGGGNFRLSLSSGSAPGVAWFPLAPGEVFRPSYSVSRGYFTNVNVSNTQVNNTYVTNIYNNGNTANVVYQHQRRPDAVTAVPASTFVQSRPVAQAAVPVSSEAVARVPSTPFAALAPTRASVAGSGAAAGTRPPGASLQRPVVARNSPPAAATPFALRQPALSKDPGKPLDAATSASLATPAAKGPSTPIRLVAPARGGAPVPIPASPTRAGGASPESPQASPRTATPTPQAPVPGVPAPQPSAGRLATPLGATTAPPADVRRAPMPPPGASVVSPPPPAGDVRRIAPAPGGAVAPPADQMRPVPGTPGASQTPGTGGGAPPLAPRPLEVRPQPPSPNAEPVPAPVPGRSEVRQDRGATVARPPVVAPPPPAAVPEARREQPRPQAAPPSVAPPPPAAVPEVRREQPRPQAAPPAPAPPAPAVAAPPPAGEPSKGGPRREAKPKEEGKNPDTQ